MTGAIAPVRRLVDVAHARGALVLLDAAQSLSHIPIDVRALGVDFLAASSHKAFGPSGVGVLYARADLLAKPRALPGRRGHGGVQQGRGGRRRIRRTRDAADTRKAVSCRGILPFASRRAPRPSRRPSGSARRFAFWARPRLERGRGRARARARRADDPRVLRAIRGSGFRILGRLRYPEVESRLALATFVLDTPGVEQEHLAQRMLVADNAGVCVSGELPLHPRAPRANQAGRHGARERSRVQHARGHRGLPERRPRSGGLT